MLTESAVLPPQTDDDSFVNVPALLGVLRQACRTTSCRREALYMGYQVRCLGSLHLCAVA